jgi:hypothetical protein
MSILVIRKHQRFAVRQSACLDSAGCKPCPGLLVEVSLDGCRFSLTDYCELAIGQQVSLQIDGFTPRNAQVRWADDKRVGLLFDRPLHNAELGTLLQDCRTDTARRSMPGTVPGSSKAA